jgi:NAD(P)H-hydrate epimerase
MTAVSAMRAGAGLVTLGTPRSLNPVLETMVMEPMTYPLPETADGMLDESAFDAVMRLLPGKTCMAIGPGLGASGQTEKLVHRLIRDSKLPLVIDADGLNNLAGNTRILLNLEAPCILTPHPGEMSRLVDASVPQIQKDRIGYALDFAVKFQVHVVLKGARTVIAHPDGRVFVNPTGNPGMASGGMGDVLTGMIAGLAAQGFSCEHAAHAGVYMHGAAADELARKKGPFGFIASDVMEIIPEEIRKRVSSLNIS